MATHRVATLLTILALSLAPPADAEPSDGPFLWSAPRAEDGRFTNRSSDFSHGSFGVRFPFFMRRIAGMFRNRPDAPTSTPNNGIWLRDNAGHSVPAVTWVGHSTLLVQMDHVTFLTDPTWSKTASPFDSLGPRRFVPPGIAMADLPPIDFVVVSHNHYDHLDVTTLTELAKRDANTRFYVPLGNAALLIGKGIRREVVEELDWGESRQYADVTIRCLPAQHWSRRGLADEAKALWASWAVSGPERSFYFAGDTGYFDGFARIAAAFGPFDLAAVPIGAYLPVAMMKEAHLNPEEAVRAALDLRAKRALAMHFGTFDLSDEPLDEPPRRFRAAAADTALDDGDAWVLQIGETREF